jgi:hypothetical protein
VTAYILTARNTSGKALPPVVWVSELFRRAETEEDLTARLQLAARHGVQVDVKEAGDR